MTLYLFSGLPVPVITWRRNRVTVNGQMDSSEPGLIRSTLLLPPLKRTDWPMTLSCSASNWERGRPLEQSFDVDMERKSIRLSVWMRLISVQRTAPAATRERMNFLSFIQVGRATERTVPNSALRKGCVGNRINRITRARWTDLTGQTREGGNNANRNLASASAVLSVFYWASALAVYNRPSRWFARPLLSTLFPILAVVFLQRHCFRLSCRFPPVFFWQLNSDSLKMVDCYSRLPGIMYSTVCHTNPILIVRLDRRIRSSYRPLLKQQKPTISIQFPFLTSIFISIEQFHHFRWPLWSARGTRRPGGHSRYPVTSPGPDPRPR